MLIHNETHVSLNTKQWRFLALEEFKTHNKLTLIMKEQFGLVRDIERFLTSNDKFAAYKIVDRKKYMIFLLKYGETLSKLK